MKSGKIKWKQLVICLAIPLAVGGLAALLTRGGMEDYGEIYKPLLSPPGWVFPVVWSILYAMMGLASYLIVLFGLALVCALRFGYIDARAGRLMAPYLVWLFFAAYLNLGVYLLN